MARELTELEVLDRLADSLGKATAAVLDLSDAIESTTAALLGLDLPSMPERETISGPSTPDLAKVAATFLGIETADPPQTQCVRCRATLESPRPGLIVCPACSRDANALPRCAYCGNSLEELRPGEVVCPTCDEENASL